MAKEKEEKMKKQYKIYWISRILPGHGINIVHAESKKEANKTAKSKFPNVDIEKVKVLK